MHLLRATHTQLERDAATAQHNCAATAAGAMQRIDTHTHIQRAKEGHRHTHAHTKISKIDQLFAAII